MNHSDLHRLSELRIKEAKILLDNACYEGAYYLSGYAVECALKACIAKQTRRHDFPDKKLVNESYTHALTKLLDAAGLRTDLKQEVKSNKPFEINWGIVKDWNEETRYRTPIPESTAMDLYSAIVNPKIGVLSWLKKRW